MITKFLALALLTTITITDAFADRNPRNRGSNNSGGRTARTERANRTRPTASRPSRPSRERTRPNTRPNRERRTPVVTRPNRNRTTPVVTRPNRPSRRRSEVNTRVRTQRRTPTRSNYGTRRYHNPYNYSHRNYRRYFHAPVARRINHRRRYTPWNYFRNISSNYRNYVYLNWILFPSTRLNGYYYDGDYPYYIHNGYRHRYSNNDTCNYQLVDKNTHNVVRTYWNQMCSNGYNRCAVDRDNRNEMEWSNKFFCAETHRNQGYDFNNPTYNYENDYSDNYSDNSNNCYDYDYDSGVCYDNY